MDAFICIAFFLPILPFVFIASSNEVMNTIQWIMVISSFLPCSVAIFINWLGERNILMKIGISLLLVLAGGFCTVIGMGVAYYVTDSDDPLITVIVFGAELMPWIVSMVVIYCASIYCVKCGLIEDDEPELTALFIGVVNFIGQLIIAGVVCEMDLSFLQKYPFIYHFIQS